MHQKKKKSFQKQLFSETLNNFNKKSETEISMSKSVKPWDFKKNMHIRTEQILLDLSMEKT